jgi:GT2 family glycosyltransferase
MNMKSFFECSFFKSPPQREGSFVVKQGELAIKDFNPSDARHKFQKQEIKYSCFWLKQENWDSSKPAIIIPIKDNNKLLKITCDNLIETQVASVANVIIVDDRSEEDIKSTAISSGFSYLRVDNDKGFNFSMLNNIAAKLCDDNGVKTIVLWNSDLWARSKEDFTSLLGKHRESGSKLSGTKLVYPPAAMSLNKEVDTDNIKTFFPNMTDGRWRETVQFGGDTWVPHPQGWGPNHFKRFAQPENPYVDCDRGCSFITGALQVWDLQYFKKLGGLNPSMAKQHQDVDLCLKAIKSGIVPMYFGKDRMFYHDESAILMKEGKNDLQTVSDSVIFYKTWNEKIPQLVF